MDRCQLPNQGYEIVLKRFKEGRYVFQPSVFLDRGDPVKEFTK